jgi:glutamate/tyrosine decarboxylase-like PLP-dependent enzyme
MNRPSRQIDGALGGVGAAEADRNAGMAARVGRHLDCARRVADRVRDSDGLELLAEPVLSICCFRFHPPVWTRRSGWLG